MDESDYVEQVRLFEDPPEDTEPREVNFTMLRLMCGWGLDMGVLLPLLELAGTKLSADERRYLIGPVVMHSRGGWHMDVPRWLLDLTRAERFETVVEKNPARIVGPAELTAVMYGAMLEAPRGTELTELYLWASINASARHYNRDIAELWKAVDHRPIEDREVLERGGRLWHVYQPLADEIVRKVVAAAKTMQSEHEEREQRQREWQERPMPAYTPPAPPAPPPPPAQSRMF